MNLYEIESEIMACVDPETGEIVDIERLDALSMEWNKKVENILCWIKNLDSDAKQIREEEKALAERRKTAENKAERLREYVSSHLNGQAFKTPKVAVSWRKSERVIVDDVKKLIRKYKDYLRFSDPEPDKTKIKEALKGGVKIPGCHLEESNNMSIK